MRKRARAEPIRLNNCTGLRLAVQIRVLGDWVDVTLRAWPNGKFLKSLSTRCGGDSLVREPAEDRSLQSWRGCLDFAGFMIVLDFNFLCSELRLCRDLEFS